MPEAVSTFNRKEYAQKHYRLNRESILARMRNHYSANKERIKARFLEWKRKNSEKFKLLTKKYGSRYHLKHPGRRAATWRRYYYRNQKKLAAQKSAYNKRVYPERKEQLLAAGRQYQLKNKIQIRAQQKEYYKRKAPERARSNKVWRSKNKEWIQKYRTENRHVEIRAAAKRRALKRGAEVDMLSIKDWMIRVKSSPAFRCYYCDGTFSTLDVHFDHVLSLTRFKIHKIGNLCTACSACNLSKGAKLPSEWIKHGQLIFDI